MAQLHDVIALARDFAKFDEARRSIERLGDAERTQALKRGLTRGADSRSIVIAALIVHIEPRLLDGMVNA